MNTKFLIILLMVVIMLLPLASAEIIYCENCSDCSAKIQNASSVDTVLLTEDIVDCIGTCIDFGGVDGITFDGGGHLIAGTRGIQDYGIYLPTYSSTNIVMNCTITDFWDGIYAFTSPYTRIYNVTSYNNRDTGITILYSTGCTVEDCSLQNNSCYDFYFVPDLLSDCAASVMNVTGSGNRSVGFYNQNTTIDDAEFSVLYLCDADYSTLNNVTIQGSDYKNNNGLRLYYTDYAQLNNISSSSNFEGACLTKSTYNHIDGAECSYNHQYGIHISYGGFNTIENTETTSDTQAGVYVGHSDYNEFKNITASASGYGIKLDRSAYNTVIDSHITNNIIDGMSFYYASDNSVYNNYFNNTDNINFVGTVYANRWNTSNTTGTNIIGGDFIGGNYWSDYTGADNNSDGFVDDPYHLDPKGYNVDWLPLIEVNGAIEPVMYIRNAGDVLVVGDVFEYLVTCENESGVICDCGELVWESDNTTVGTMNGGNLTCLAVGYTDITVEGFGLIDTITQEVIAAPSGINNVTMQANDYYVPDCGSTIVEVRMNSSNNVEEWRATIEFDPNVVNITECDFSGTLSESFGEWSHNGSYIVAWGMSHQMGSVSGDWRLVNLTVSGNGTGVTVLEFNESECFLAEGEVPVFHNATWEGCSMQYVGCGDVDCDGFVSSNDVLETYRRAVNPYYPLEFEWAANADGDTFISSNDVLEIYRRAVNPYYLLNCECG